MSVPKSGRRFASCFLEKLLTDCFGFPVVDHISNSRLYKKRVSILFLRAIMRKRLRGLGHVLWMKNDELQRLFSSANCLGVNGKQVVSGCGEGCRKERFK